MDFVQKFLKRGTTDTVLSGQCSSLGSLYVSDLLPPYAALVNENCVWKGMSAKAGAVSIVAIPTTAAMFTLQNYEPTGGKTYFILDVWALCIVNAAALASFSLIGCLDADRKSVV